MPALVGLTLDEGLRALAGQRLPNIVRTRRAAHPEPRGRIYAQSPSAGAVLGAADTIVLDVSDGPAPEDFD